MKEYKDGNILKGVPTNQVYDKGSGRALVSDTFNKTVIGIVSGGKWIGDEAFILKDEIPQFYSAICMTEVKAYRIKCVDYINRLPGEIKQKMEGMVYEKLYQYRDKLADQNVIKHNLELSDRSTRDIAKAIGHFQNIYSSGSLSIHKKLIKQY